jgi:hypothetical protein
MQMGTAMSQDLFMELQHLEHFNYPALLVLLSLLQSMTLPEIVYGLIKPGALFKIPEKASQLMQMETAILQDGFT